MVKGGEKGKLVSAHIGKTFTLMLQNTFRISKYGDKFIKLRPNHYIHICSRFVLSGHNGGATFCEYIATTILVALCELQLTLHSLALS